MPYVDTRRWLLLFDNTIRLMFRYAAAVDAVEVTPLLLMLLSLRASHTPYVMLPLFRDATDAAMLFTLMRFVFAAATPLD